MPESVTPQYLLEGAVYALEQCGLLLRDGTMLHRNGSHANAVALAAFAREELGRWKILLNLRSEVLGGKSLTLKEIKARCDDHVTKQKAGMLSLTMRPPMDSGVGRLMQARMQFPPGSKEWKEADAQLEKINNEKRKRIPDERHRQRMSALYVEPLSGGSWNQPARRITQEFSQEFVCDAVNDYAVQYHQDYITGDDPILKQLDPDLFNALEQWPDRPELPRPDWPHLPPS